MKILVAFPFSAAQRRELDTVAQRHGKHEVQHFADAASAVGAAAEVEVLIGRITPELCLAAPHLRWGNYFGAGLERLLTPEVVALPFTLTNMAGKFAVQGAEHAWALLLALARGVGRAVADRRWEAYPVVSLTGGTLLIIGLGGFGMETLRRAAGYDLTVLALDPAKTERPDGVAELRPPTRANLHALLARADAVVVACPLIPATYHMIGAEELAQMKSSAYLVNVSRGGIIDEPPLIEALHAGRIAGAGLDVCEVEPLPDDSPLWTTPNLIVTPHRAGFSQRRAAETFTFALEQLERYLTGQPLENVTDKRAGF